MGTQSRFWKLHTRRMLRHGNVGVHVYTWYAAGVSCAKVLRLRCFGVRCFAIFFNSKVWTGIYISIQICILLYLLCAVYINMLWQISFPLLFHCDVLWPATSGQTIFQTLPFLFLGQREIIPLLSRCGHHMPANSFAILHSPPFVANPQRIHT